MSRVPNENCPVHGVPAAPETIASEERETRADPHAPHDYGPLAPTNTLPPRVYAAPTATPETEDGRLAYLNFAASLLVLSGVKDVGVWADDVLTHLDDLADARRRTAPSEPIGVRRPE